MSKITKETIFEKLKQLDIEEDKPKIRTDDEINNIALKIVGDTKKIVESIFFNNYENVKQELLEYYENYPYESEEKSFSLNLFNDHNLFYEELQRYNNSNIRRLFNYESRLLTLKNNFNNSFSIINFSILTELLIEILTKDKHAFKDDIIKSDISILIEVITSKETRITNSNSLFLCFVNELKEKYQTKKETLNSKFIEKINELVNIKAPEKLDKIKKELYTFIKDKTFQIINEYKNDIRDKFQSRINEDSEDFSDIDKFIEKVKIFREFYDEIQNNQKTYQENLVELKKKCMEENVHYFFEYYSEKLLKKDGYQSCTKDYILNNLLLPFKIIEINLNNIEDRHIIYNIPDNYAFEPIDKYYNTFLGCYLANKEELNYKNGKNYKKEIVNIINEDEFIKDFFSIISSGEITKYFESKIMLEDNYHNFLKDMKGNYKKFRELIIIKQICYKIPAMTNSSMKIYINPIYEISDNLKNENEKVNYILKSVLLILLVHLLDQFLKAYNPIKTLGKNYPIIPIKKDIGGCLINYLFNTCIIQSINYEQSILLNKIDTWNNLNLMRGLFQKPKDDSLKNNGKLDLYLIESDEDIPDEKRGEYCLW